MKNIRVRSHVFLLSVFALLSSGNSVETATAQWSKAGLDQLQVKCLVVVDARLYAATFGQGIFYSDNYGDSWHELNEGLQNKSVYSLIVHGDSLIAGTRSGVYFITPLATAWALLTTAWPSETRAYSLLSISDKIYVGSKAGVFKVNGKDGQSTLLTTGMSAEPYVLSLAMNGSSILAGTQDGLYNSADLGNSWSIDSNVPKLTVGQVGFLNKLVFAPTDGEGIAKFQNGKWSLANNGLTSLKVFTVLAVNGKIICGTSQGVFESSDQGANWRSLNNALTSSSVVNNFAFTQGLLFACTDQGIYKIQF
jgi:ligand-binding sensor domain-containing protein